VRKDVEMPDMIPVKIRPLSGDAFRPYGQVLERGALVYPETEDGRVAMELLRVWPSPPRSKEPARAVSETSAVLPVCAPS